MVLVSRWWRPQIRLITRIEWFGGAFFPLGGCFIARDLAGAPLFGMRPQPFRGFATDGFLCRFRVLRANLGASLIASFAPLRLGADTPTPQATKSVLENYLSSLREALVVLAEYLSRQRFTVSARHLVLGYRYLASRHGYILRFPDLHRLVAMVLHSTAKSALPRLLHRLPVGASPRELP